MHIPFLICIIHEKTSFNKRKRKEKQYSTSIRFMNFTFSMDMNVHIYKLIMSLENELYLIHKTHKVSIKYLTPLGY